MVFQPVYFPRIIPHLADKQPFHGAREIWNDKIDAPSLAAARP
jgi:hypothetical protein